MPKELPHTHHTVERENNRVQNFSFRRRIAHTTGRGKRGLHLAPTKIRRRLCSAICVQCVCELLLTPLSRRLDSIKCYTYKIEKSKINSASNTAIYRKARGDREEKSGCNEIQVGAARNLNRIGKSSAKENSFCGCSGKIRSKNQHVCSTDLLLCFPTAHTHKHQRGMYIYTFFSFSRTFYLLYFGFFFRRVRPSRNPLIILAVALIVALALYTLRARTCATDKLRRARARLCYSLAQRKDEKRSESEAIY